MCGQRQHKATFVIPKTVPREVANYLPTLSTYFYILSYADPSHPQHPVPGMLLACWAAYAQSFSPTPPANVHGARKLFFRDRSVPNPLTSPLVQTFVS